MERMYFFPAAVRGYHYYWTHCNPVENEQLFCMQEPGNCFDRFAIKLLKEKEEIIGHLPCY